MILAIDIGNTTITFGVFDRHQLILRFSLPASSRTTPQKCWAKLQAFLAPHMKIDGAICCSVVPDLSVMINSFANEFLKAPLKKLMPDDRIGISNRYSKPEQVGGDRIVNALAAKHLYSLPAIIIDIGTAVTIDVVNAQSEYLGGIITPGLGVSAEALRKKTALLPKVELLIPRGIVGTDTESSIQSGLTYGFAGMIRSLVRELRRDLGMEEVTVLATGGYVRVLEPLLDDIATAIDENLTLKGLDIAHELI